MLLRSLSRHPTFFAASLSFGQAPMVTPSHRCDLGGSLNFHGTSCSLVPVVVIYPVSPSLAPSSTQSLTGSSRPDSCWHLYHVPLSGGTPQIFAEWRKEVNENGACNDTTFFRADSEPWFPEQCLVSPGPFDIQLKP